MYGSVCAYSNYIDKWFRRKAGVLNLNDYLKLIEIVRNRNYSIKIRFGLEICYFKEFESFVYQETKGKEFDFLVGSLHYINNFAYDHKSDHWAGINVDEVYRNYFEASIDFANSGIYDGIAHPDCIKIFGHRPSYILYDYYNKLAEVLSKSNMYAEQNGGAHRRCPDTSELGMNTDMIKAMKHFGVRILTASDAHCPEDVGANIYELEQVIK